MRMPAARAMATRWRVWLVEPPVASRPTMPFTMARSSITRPRGVYSGLPSTRAAARAAARRVSASSRGEPAGTKAEPGRCRPMSSMSIWLLLAVP